MSQVAGADRQDLILESAIRINISALGELLEQRGTRKDIVLAYLLDKVLDLSNNDRVDPPTGVASSETNAEATKTAATSDPNCDYEREKRETNSEIGQDGLPKWLTETPDPTMYNLTMYDEGGSSIQELDLSRAEYIELKRQLWQMRSTGWRPTDEEEKLGD